MTRPRFSSSSNPPGGKWVAGATHTCDYCTRCAEWAFNVKVPRLSGPAKAFGCGIHWSQAKAESEGRATR